MNKLITILLCVALVLAFSSCAKSNEDADIGADGAADNSNNSNAPTDSELLSAPYAEMLRSGEYQYSYPVTYEGAEYVGIIAAKNGMVSRSVIANDGSYSQRVVTINGNAWQVDDLTGNVWNLGTALEVNGAKALPDYGASLTFAAARELETGAMAEAYDFTYEDEACNMVFVFDSNDALVEIIMTMAGTTTEMFVTEMVSPADATLFEASAR